jgi:hypothetical protein
MKNLLKFFVLFTLLTGCGSTPTQPAKTSPSSITTFSAIDLSLNLSQKQIVDGYPDQEKLNEIIKERSVAKFNEAKLLSSVSSYSAKISIAYQRRFAGEDTPIPSKSVMAPIVSYTIVIFDKDVEIQKIEKTGLTTNKGFASNLKTTFTLGLGRTAKDEEQDYAMLVNTLQSELLNMTK